LQNGNNRIAILAVNLFSSYQIEHSEFMMIE